MRGKKVTLGVQEGLDLLLTENISNSLTSGSVIRSRGNIIHLNSHILRIESIFLQKVAKHDGLCEKDENCLPSSAIERTEFSTSQSKSLSVSMAFFTVLETVLSSINFVT